MSYKLEIIFHKLQMIVSRKLPQSGMKKLDSKGGIAMS